VSPRVPLFKLPLSKLIAGDVALICRLALT
jgi:hypothetical protein